MDWLKDHLIEALAFIGTCLTAAYAHGRMAAKLDGHAERIETLEQKSGSADSLSESITVMQSVVSAQGEHIAKIADAVSKDHDILIRACTIIDREKPK